ncbi:MAG: hypothetical protein ACKOPM_11050 [Novosphingobium sp.]
MSQNGDEESEIVKLVKALGAREDHEIMPSGEGRLRLTFKDGNNFIRTVATDTGCWQQAHVHDRFSETTIVERGWVALAERRDGILRLQTFGEGQIFTSVPGIAHNLYVSANTVLHTVKHGNDGAGKWTADQQLSSETSALSEGDILRLALPGGRETITIDNRFGGYISLYNNLDSLLWGVPSIFALGITVLLGFLSSKSSFNEIVSTPPIATVSVLVLTGCILLLGAYLTVRIRHFHTVAGREIEAMDRPGYFHHRSNSFRILNPPAPYIFVFFYLLLAGIAFGTAWIIIWENDLFLRILLWRPQ